MIWIVLYWVCCAGRVVSSRTAEKNAGKLIYIARAVQFEQGLSLIFIPIIFLVEAYLDHELEYERRQHAINGTARRVGVPHSDIL
eukprot:scaffold31315_cov49-Attheya_sp.AAC.5